LISFFFSKPFFILFAFSPRWQRKEKPIYLFEHKYLTSIKKLLFAQKFLKH
jgi:hypothetical protein